MLGAVSKLVWVPLDAIFLRTNAHPRVCVFNLLSRFCVFHPAVTTPTTTITNDHDTDDYDTDDYDHDTDDYDHGDDTQRDTKSKQPKRRGDGCGDNGDVYCNGDGRRTTFHGGDCHVLSYLFLSCLLPSSMFPSYLVVLSRPFPSRLSQFDIFLSSHSPSSLFRLLLFFPCVPSQSRLLYAPANTNAASQHAPTQIPDGVSASHARPAGGLGGLQSLAGLPHVWQGAVSSVDDMLLISEACNRPHYKKSHDLHLYRDVALQDMML